jgi:hypothetical protein
MGASRPPVSTQVAADTCAGCIPSPTQADLTHANILAELHCEAGRWAAVLALTQRAERELLGPEEELPLDLRVRAVPWEEAAGMLQAGTDTHMICST